MKTPDYFQGKQDDRAERTYFFLDANAIHSFQVQLQFLEV